MNHSNHNISLNFSDLGCKEKSAKCDSFLDKSPYGNALAILSGSKEHSGSNSLSPFDIKNSYKNSPKRKSSFVEIKKVAISEAKEQLLEDFG